MKDAAIIFIASLLFSSAHASEWADALLRDYADSPHREFMQTCLNDNPSATDEQGRTLLLYCLQELPEMNFPVQVHVLLMAGQNPNAVIPATGQTALHLAAQLEDYRLALRLLAFGADYRLRDKQGRTAADLAKTTMLQELLSTGTPVELKSDSACDIHAKACAGDAAAQYEMSLIYSDGIGKHAHSISELVYDHSSPDPDAAESRAWLEQAAAAEEPRALAELGMRLLWGRDGHQDEAQGRRYLQRAAELGHTGAAEILNGL